MSSETRLTLYTCFYCGNGWLGDFAVGPYELYKGMFHSGQDCQDQINKPSYRGIQGLVRAGLVSMSEQQIKMYLREGLMEEHNLDKYMDPIYFVYQALAQSLIEPEN